MGTGTGGRRDAQDVFVNIPFDPSYERNLIALAAGLTALGLTPRSVLEIQDAGQGRLLRIFELLESCRVSIHDLSRVQTSLVQGRRLPRFNMPFELGLAAALKLGGRGHRFFVMVSDRLQLGRSLSDLGGIDPLVHGGKPDGVLGCLLDAFAVPGNAVGIRDLRRVHETLGVSARRIKRENGSEALRRRRGFQLLVATAAGVAARDGLIAG